MCSAISWAAAGSGNENDLQNDYEIQNYTSLIQGNHMLKFGGRVRATQDTNYSTSGFNSTFSFSSLITSTDTPTNCAALGQNPACPISLLYAEQQLSPSGGGIPYATQLTYTTGLPTTAVTYYDVEPYIQDDWQSAAEHHSQFGPPLRNPKRHS